MKKNKQVKLTKDEIKQQHAAWDGPAVYKLPLALVEVMQAETGQTVRHILNCGSLIMALSNAESLSKSDARYNAKRAQLHREMVSKKSSQNKEE